MSVKRHVGEGWIVGSWVWGRKGWVGARPQSSRLTPLLTLTCYHRHLLNVIFFRSSFPSDWILLPLGLKRPLSVGLVNISKFNVPVCTLVRSLSFIKDCMYKSLRKADLYLYIMYTYSIYTIYLQYLISFKCGYRLKKT